jgi:hypothetical protein
MRKEHWCSNANWQTRSARKTCQCHCELAWNSIQPSHGHSLKIIIIIIIIIIIYKVSVYDSEMDGTCSMHVVR